MRDAPKLIRPKSTPKPVPPPQADPMAMDIQQLNPVPSTSTAPMNWGNIMDQYDLENRESPLAKRSRQERENDESQVTLTNELDALSVDDQDPEFVVCKAESCLCPRSIKSPLVVFSTCKPFFQKSAARPRVDTGSFKKQRDSSSSRSRPTASSHSSRERRRTPSRATTGSRASTSSHRPKSAIRPHKDLPASCLPSGMRIPNVHPTSFRIPKEASS